jgi:hypothetical protein
MNESVELAVTIFLIVLAFGLLLIGFGGFSEESDPLSTVQDRGILEDLKTWVLAHKWLVSGLIIFISVVLVSKWIDIQTGVFTAVLLAIVLVLVEWLPVWVPVVLGVLAAGILAWMISR